MQQKTVFLWDLIGAIFVAMMAYLVLPYHIHGFFQKEIYFTGILLLGPLFAVDLFITSLTLEYKSGQFPDQLKFLFKLTFVALFYSLLLYFYTDYSTQVNPGYVQNKTWIVLEIFGVLYTIFSTFNFIMTTSKETSSKS